MCIIFIRKIIYLNILCLSISCSLAAGTYETICEAISKHDHQKLRALLLKDNFEHINIQDLKTGFTPLHKATKCACVQCVKILIYSGANPFIADFSGDSALNHAFKITHYQKKGLIIYRILEALSNWQCSFNSAMSQ